MGIMEESRDEKFRVDRAKYIQGSIVRPMDMSLANGKLRLANDKGNDTAATERGEPLTSNIEEAGTELLALDGKKAANHAAQNDIKALKSEVQRLTTKNRDLVRDLDQKTDAITALKAEFRKLEDNSDIENQARDELMVKYKEEKSTSDKWKRMFEDIQSVATCMPATRQSNGAETCSDKNDERMKQDGIDEAIGTTELETGTNNGDDSDKKRKRTDELQLTYSEEQSTKQAQSEKATSLQALQAQSTEQTNQLDPVLQPVDVEIPESVAKAPHTARKIHFDRLVKETLALNQDFETRLSNLKDQFGLTLFPLETIPTYYFPSPSTAIEMLDQFLKDQAKLQHDYKAQQEKLDDQFELFRLASIAKHAGTVACTATPSTYNLNGTLLCVRCSKACQAD